MTEQVQIQNNMLGLQLSEDDLQEVDPLLIEEHENLRDVQLLEKEVQDINESVTLLAQYTENSNPMLNNIESNLDKTVDATNEGVEELTEASVYAEKIRNTKTTLIMVGTGLGIGALGFIAGPIVGIPTLIAGGIIGGGAAKVYKKI